MHSAPLTIERACRREQYCILVRIKTARDKKPLQAHAWGEALLKDFFQAIIGVLYAVMVISPTEHMLFARVNLKIWECLTRIPGHTANS